MTPQRPLETCIFCSHEFSPGKRGEDVIPIWYAKEIGHPACVVLAGSVDATGSATPANPRKSQTVAAKEFRLAGACHSLDEHVGCNGSWMSGIEETAKPILLPLMQGAPTTLDSSAQKTLATWAQLKAITFDAVTAPRVLDPPIAHAFMLDRPLRNLGVSIGRVAAASPTEITLARNRGTLPEALAIRGSGPVEVVRLTIVFNCLALSVVSVQEGRVPIELFTRRSLEEFAGIWPPLIGDENAAVVWPPTRDLNATTLGECF